MSFLRDIIETFRDHTRDDVCYGLQRLGTNAQMATRHRPEEKIGVAKIGYKDSLGIIDIPEGPIRWVNIIRVSDSESGTSHHYIEYGIPDSRLDLNSTKPRIKTVRMRTLPKFGKVVDLHWKGKDFGFEIINRLNSDTSLKESMMRSPDVEIRAHGDHGCWILSTKTRDIPSRELWNCYQAIAHHLLTD